MKIKLLKVIIGTGLLASLNITNAGSNNGYTSATNVYTGSSSLGWYGGGVAYRLDEWKKMAAREAAEKKATEVKANLKAEEATSSESAASSSTVESVEEKTVVEDMSAPEAPAAPSSPKEPTDETTQVQ